MASGIYRIDLGNGNFYIGSAANFTKRKSKHRNELKHKIHRNTRMQNCWNKYQIFKFIILEECAKNDLIVREQFYIDQNRDNPKMTNICLVAGSSLGRIASIETRTKMSAAAKNKVVSAETRAKLSKRVYSAETRAKLSAIAKCRVHSVETRKKISVAKQNVSDETRAKLSRWERTSEYCAKISAANKGKKLSVETRAKISAYQKNKVVSAETRAKMSKARKAYYARKREAA
jgi:group I intron endonuclease